MSNNELKPLLGLTVGTAEAVERATDFGVDFCDLHFGGKVDVDWGTQNNIYSIITATIPIVIAYRSSVQAA